MNQKKQPQKKRKKKADSVPKRPPMDLFKATDLMIHLRMNRKPAKAKKT